MTCLVVGRSSMRAFTKTKSIFAKKQFGGNIAGKQINWDTNAAMSLSSTVNGQSELLVTRTEGVRVIKFNRPRRKNALTSQMYLDIPLALEEAKQDPETCITVLTGEGDYYSSGNDLSNFTSIPTGSDIEEFAKEAGERLGKFIAAFIDFPKPLVAVVNGPALGISVTTLGLCDLVYVSDKATFQTPFTSLGQSAEGCASLIFPRIMGLAKASEVLLFGKKLTAQDALRCGLVTEVFPDEKLAEVWPRLRTYAQLPPNSLMDNKNLVRNRDRALLHQVNRDECELLVKRWQSEECMNALLQFFQRKSKL